MTSGRGGFGGGVWCALGVLASGASADLPITEVTAFKDGHALVLREGVVDLDASGDVVMRELPRPVLGTFWAEEHEARGNLSSVVVSSSPGSAEIEADTIEGLLRANLGRQITFLSASNAPHAGVLLDVITPAPGQPDPRTGALRTAPGNVLALIDLDGAVTTLPISSMREIAFVGGPPARQYEGTIEQESLTMNMEWEGAAPESADVSVMYLQRGLRWIPSYRVTMLDDESVRIELQATLINELADLRDATVHLAVGVPSFAFDHTPDPIALRESFDQLGLFFQTRAPGNTGNMLSNAIMSQSARMTEVRPGGHGGGTPGDAPQLGGGERVEDLFVYTVTGVSLDRDARMVLPIVSYEAPMERVYRLAVYPNPPAQAYERFNSHQQREIARLLARPLAKQVLRITNDNDERYPITTAPAIIVKDGRTLAQALITYTAPGGTVDLEVGEAVDIAVDVEEVETDRTINVPVNGYHHTRIDFEQSLTITNRKPHAVELEIASYALGIPNQTDPLGNATAISFFSDEAFWGVRDGAWWHWYSWPGYWHRTNGAVRFDWSMSVEPGERVDLTASWHAFWR